MISHSRSNSFRTVSPVTAFTFTASLGLLFMMLYNGPLLQDPGYHNFTDQRTYLGIAHFWNVITNIPYIIVGIAGLLYSGNFHPDGALATINRAFQLFFFFLILTGLGSGYYHLNPDNASLFWDRLPLAAAFMAFLDLVICTFGAEKIGRKLLIPLVLIGISSVLLWKFGEKSGAGDLRMYAAVQCIPLLIIPGTLYNGNSGYIDKRDMVMVLLCYVLAKIMELSDPKLSTDYFLSGHSLKHLISGYGCVWIYLLYRKMKRYDLRA